MLVPPLSRAGISIDTTSAEGGSTLVEAVSLELLLHFVIALVLIRQALRIEGAPIRPAPRDALKLPRATRVPPLALKRRLRRPAGLHDRRRPALVCHERLIPAGAGPDAVSPVRSCPGYGVVHIYYGCLAVPELVVLVRVKPSEEGDHVAGIIARQHLGF